MTQPTWELFAHEADIGVRGYGKTIAEAFAHGAKAMTSAITDISEIHSRTKVLINCSAPDLELLFVDWLNAIIYEMDVRNMLFSKFDVSVENNILNATIYGEPLNQLQHHPAVYVKGATYTALKVTQENGIWIAQCVVDV